MSLQDVIHRAAHWQATRSYRAPLYLYIYCSPYTTGLTSAAGQIMPLRAISQGSSKTEVLTKLSGTNLEEIDAELVSKELFLVQGASGRHSMLQVRALHSEILMQGSRPKARQRRLRQKRKQRKSPGSVSAIMEWNIESCARVRALTLTEAELTLLRSTESVLTGPREGCFRPAAVPALQHARRASSDSSHERMGASEPQSLHR